MMEAIPNVLVCSPTAESKRYCEDDWLDSVHTLSYPKYDIMLVDNSPNKANAKRLNGLGVHTKYISPKNKDITQTLAVCHNVCRDYAKQKGYDYILHLETDVFPPKDVIEELMLYNKPVIGGWYDVFYGTKRKSVIQITEDKNAIMDIAPYLEDYDTTFCDGEVKRCYHTGLGCSLIHKNIFSQIPFRMIKGEFTFPDSVFAYDLFVKGIPMYVHTGVVCEHRNHDWGFYKIDFK